MHVRQIVMANDRETDRFTVTRTDSRPSKRHTLGEPCWEHRGDHVGLRLAISGNANSANLLSRLQARLEFSVQHSNPHLIQINVTRSYWPHTWPSIRWRLSVPQEPDTPELQPWDRAPVGGYYLLLNVFGRPTGERAFVERGCLLPSAPRPHRWRLEDAADDTWMHRAIG